MSLFGDYLPNLLPDDPDKNAAVRQGLLALGATMMGSRGNFGESLGNGLLAGSNGYAGMLAQQGQQQLRAAQLKQTGLENDKLQAGFDTQKAGNSILARSFSTGAPGAVQPVSALPQLGQPRPQVAQPAAPMGGANFNMGYGNDAPEAMPNMPQQATATAQPAAQPAAGSYEKYMRIADDLAPVDASRAKLYYDMAEKMKPKYATEFRQAMGPDGKLRNYMVAEDGTFKDAGLGVKPDMVATDVGGKVVWSDKNTLAPGSSLDKSQSPDSVASTAASRYGTDVQARTAGNRLSFDRDQATAENAPDTTTQKEKELWLHTYAANNGQMPRSAPPAVRKNIGTWAAEMGITPNDLSSGAAKAKFDQAMAVTAGHRGGAMASVEATMPALVDNAVELSHKLGQGKFVPLNQLMLMADDKISDPNVAAFKVGHMAVVSEYQQVISRGGTNVTALNEAMRVLNAARSMEAYDAAMKMVKKEVAINVAGTQAVRANLGSANHGAAPVVNVQPLGELKKLAPPVGTVKGGFRFNGKGDAGNPANWEKVQ